MCCGTWEDSGDRTQEPDPTECMSRVDHTELEASYRHCRRMSRRSGSRLWRGYEATPEPARGALDVLLAWQAEAEAIVAAASGADETAALTALGTFGRLTEAAADSGVALPEGAVWPAFRQVVGQYTLPVEELRLPLQGWFGELSGVSCQSFDDLYRYCHQRAATMALLFARVWGDDGDSAVIRLIEYRAVALQLTYLIGRVRLHARQGKLYLPQEDMRRFGCSVGHLAEGPADQAFRRLMQFQIERNRSYYDMSASLERHLSEQGRLASWLVLQHGTQLLERIAHNLAGLSSRPMTLPWSVRLRIKARARLRRDWG